MHLFWLDWLHFYLQYRIFHHTEYSCVYRDFKMEKTKPHGFSQHSAEDSVLQGVKRKGSAFTFLKRILPTICFHKVPPQSGNGCRARAENTSCNLVWPSNLTNVLCKLVRNVFFSFLYMFTNTQKHVHTQIYTQSARLLFSLGIFLQPPSSSVHSLTAAGVLKLQFTVPPVRTLLC